MTFSGLLVFAAAYALAVASPGPGVAATIARGLGFGTRGLLPYLLGFVVGDLVWFGAAATGLSLLAQSFAGVFTVIRYAGAAYLLWLGWKLWTARVDEAAETASLEGSGGGWRAFLSSLSLTLGNPKAIIFFLALLPSLIDLDGLTPLSFVEVAAVMSVIISAVMAAYALMAARARRLFTSAKSVQRLNRVTGGVMAGAAVAVASR